MHCMPCIMYALYKSTSTVQIAIQYTLHLTSKTKLTTSKTPSIPNYIPIRTDKSCKIRRRTTQMLVIQAYCPGTVKPITQLNLEIRHLKHLLGLSHNYTHLLLTTTLYHSCGSWLISYPFQNKTTQVLHPDTFQLSLLSALAITLKKTMVQYILLTQHYTK